MIVASSHTNTPTVRRNQEPKELPNGNRPLNTGTTKCRPAKKGLELLMTQKSPTSVWRIR